MLGIAASLSFLLMMFNVPIPGGTTAHGVLLNLNQGPYAASLARRPPLSSSLWRWRNSYLAQISSTWRSQCHLSDTLFIISSVNKTETAGVLIWFLRGDQCGCFLNSHWTWNQPIIATQRRTSPVYGLAVDSCPVTHLTDCRCCWVFFTYVIYRFVKQRHHKNCTQLLRVNHDFFRKRENPLCLIALVVLSPLGLLAEEQPLENGQLMSLLKWWITSQQESKWLLIRSPLQWLRSLEQTSQSVIFLSAITTINLLYFRKNDSINEWSKASHA